MAELAAIGLFGASATILVGGAFSLVFFRGLRIRVLHDELVVPTKVGVGGSLRASARRGADLKQLSTLLEADALPRAVTARVSVLPVAARDLPSAILEEGMEADESHLARISIEARPVTKVQPFI